MDGIRALIMLMLFSGMALLLHSIYDEKLKRAEKQVRIEYRFLPRTLYEEQMQQSDLMGHYKGMFSKDAPWYGTQMT